MTTETTIDTDAFTIGGVAVPTGTRFERAAQASSDGNSDVKELALLRVGAFRIGTGAQVRVVGSRPLAIVSATTIEILGTLDGAARGESGGPGATDIGGGGTGDYVVSTGNSANHGGGGGSFGGEGARGGLASCGCVGQNSPGNPGSSYGEADQMFLLAGSRGGGARSDVFGLCNASGGAGGGAIQLSAVNDVTIGPSGVVNVGGGGGERGDRCATSSGGGGGGSGGAVFLESRDGTVGISGVVAANGGGGGSGDPGNDGEDGLAAMQSASGGDPDGTQSGRGGDSAFGQSEAATGSGWQSTTDGNAGGGGGGVGRITILSGTAPTLGGTISPQAATIAP